MLLNWLAESKRMTSPYLTIRVIDVTEKNTPDQEILDYLGEEFLNSYRDIKNIKREFSSKDKNELIHYLTSAVFPPDKTLDPFRVRQGDFGEVLARLIIQNFRNLHVPGFKLRWKVDNSKAVSLTDIIAHNKGEEIKDIKFYEVKTYTAPTTSLGTKAHGQLKKDSDKGINVFIADFIKRQYQDKAQVLEDAGNIEEANKNWSMADKYSDITLHPKNYKHSFEIIIIVEKKKYKEDILTKLEAIEKKLSPLDVSIVLVDDLEKLVDSSFDTALKYCCKEVYPSN